MDYLHQPDYERNEVDRQFDVPDLPAEPDVALADLLHVDEGTELRAAAPARRWAAAAVDVALVAATATVLGRAGLSAAGAWPALVALWAATTFTGTCRGRTAGMWVTHAAVIDEATGVPAPAVALRRVGVVAAAAVLGPAWLVAAAAVQVVALRVLRPGQGLEDVVAGTVLVAAPRTLQLRPVRSGGRQRP